MCVCVCVCACVCACVLGFYRFYQVFPIGPVWPHWLPRVGSLPHHSRPTVQARGICVPVLPLDQCDVHFRPEPGSLPQDHPGSGVVALWLPPGQLHGISSTSPSSPCCPVCCVCIGASTAGGARGSEAARRPPRPTHLASSPERMPWMHGCRRPPPDMPAPGIEPTTLRLQDLRLARLS